MVNIKSFKTYDELIQIMQDRGLEIQDVATAKDILHQINYYRFSAYFLTYKLGENFYPETTFENIYDLYRFDYELRHFLMRFISHVEIGFRNAISHTHCDRHTPMGYRDSKNFSKASRHKEFIYDIDESTNKSNEIFITHHKKKYNGAYPFWVAIQTISLGCLSKLYSNLLVEDRKHIARNYYNLRENIVSSWLKGVSDLRNVCAHWGRLYNRPLPSISLDRKSYPEGEISRKRVFAYMVALFNLLQHKNYREEMRLGLRELLEKFPTVMMKHLGCDGDWDTYLYV
jgi:abortive infection bacteriophage resistance protein